MNLKEASKHVLFRTVRIFGRMIYHKHTWLISDRASAAGDNGEAFFRFLQDKPVHSVFAISPSSLDYPRMQEIGEVVEYGSLKYKFLLCVADCHCSSQMIHMENHTETPQIFLQHGITDKNIARMINPACHKNFYLVGCSKIEDFNVDKNAYKLDSKHILNVGFPRLDYLENGSSKLIVLAFTWRSELSRMTDDSFEKTYYYKEIKRILTDDRLHELISSKGYKLAIKMHPEIARYRNLFKQTDRYDLYMKSYQELYKEADIMITDYSSCVFDFAYLGKPYIYYQFDNGKYFENNPFVSRGADYKEIGLGPVVNSFDELVSEIEKCIDNGCCMAEEYKKRTDNFFFYRDKNNCERLYKKICDLVGVR